MSTPHAGITRALVYAVRYGGIDGDHHKAWVIDQMVRALTDCPLETRIATAVDGLRYTYEAQGESDAYRDLVTHDWDVGIAP